MRTGWDNGLCQDYCKGLARWFSSRLDAREVVRRFHGDQTIKGHQMTNPTTTSAPSEHLLSTIDREAVIERVAAYFAASPVVDTKVGHLWLSKADVLAVLRSQPAATHPQQPSATGGDGEERAWLIEQVPLRGSPACYFTGLPDQVGRAAFSRDPLKAVRFARQEDAERVLTMLDLMDAHIQQGPDWVLGQRIGMGRLILGKDCYRVTEHMWCDPASQPTSGAAVPKGAGMAATVLATELVEALHKDEAGDGCDISAGLIGPNVSEWLRGLASMALAAPLATPPAQPSAAGGDDSARLDHLQHSGSTVSLVPGAVDVLPLRFMVGGLHKAVSSDLRAAIDIARGISPASQPVGAEYGGIELGHTFAIPPRVELLRLMSFVERTYGNDHPAFDDLEALVAALAAQPAPDGRGTDAQIEKERQIAKHAIVGSLAAGYAGAYHPGPDHWLAAAHDAGARIRELEGAQPAAQQVVPEGHAVVSLWDLKLLAEVREEDYPGQGAGAAERDAHWFAAYSRKLDQARALHRKAADSTLSATSTAALPAQQADKAAAQPVTDEVEKVWRDFWVPLVAPNGTPDMGLIKNELSDFHHLIEQVPKVYMHVTGGMVSKHMTRASVVCSLHDDHVTELVEEREKEVRDELATAAEPAAQQGVPVYQYQRADGSWIDQTKASHDYNVRHGQAVVRVVYTTPQPSHQARQPMTGEQVGTKGGEV
jgi:hypothetical protein